MLCLATRRLTRLLAAIVAAGACLLAAGQAHPGAQPPPHRSGAPPWHPDHADPDAAARPTDDQIAKRLEHVRRRAEQRRAKRAERRRDRRKVLRRLMRKRLRGTPLTAEVTSELRAHARRVAWLRQIAYVAANKKDFQTVVRVDKTLARENTRHEGFWRQLHRRARAGDQAGGAPAMAPAMGSVTGDTR